MTIEVRDEREVLRATGRFPMDRAGYRQLLRYVWQWPCRLPVAAKFSPSTMRTDKPNTVRPGMPTGRGKNAMHRPPPQMVLAVCAGLPSTHKLRRS